MNLSRSDAATIGVGSYLLLCVAIYNGYPLVFPDTGWYLAQSVYATALPHRPIFYGLFIRMVGFGISPWLVVFSQSIMAATASYTVFESIVRDTPAQVHRNRWFVGVVLVLCVVSSLPWFAGELMPDIFASIAFLSVFLLVYDHEISGVRRLILACMVGLSVSVHLANLAEFAALTIPVALLMIAFPKLRPSVGLRTIAISALLPIIVASSLVALSNKREFGTLTLSPAAHAFLLGRLFRNGMAAPYIREHCPTANWIVCQYVDRLPQNENEFLWARNSLLEKMGGFVDSKREANEIIIGIIASRPGAFGWDCAKAAIRQFATFTTWEVAEPRREEWYLYSVLQSLFPQEIPKFRETRQWAGALEKWSIRLAPFQVFAFWLSLALGLWMIRSRSVSSRVAQLFWLSLLFLLVNASVTATLSAVWPRYQGRVSWIMPFWLLTTAVSHFSSKQAPIKSLLSPAASDKVMLHQ